MRTTLNTIYNMIESNLHKITVDMARVNNQISSGRKWSSISEDPVNLISALGMRSTLAEITQFQENITFGDSMIAASESALTGLKDLVMDSRDQALIAINDSQTAATRLFVADEIHVYLEEMVTVANTRWDGKYVFGGSRTTGYTDLEPTPFMLGYIDGYRINGSNVSPLESSLTGTIGNTDLNAGDLLINGEDVGNVVLSAGNTNGLNMTGAANLQTAINGIAWPVGTTPVTANLTTLYAAGAETAGGPTDVSITLNGTTITYSTTGLNPAQDAVTALNQYSGQTGVKAALADGTNGGAAPPPNSIVLTNIMEGDESAINITALSEVANPPGPPAATSGLAVGAHTVAGGNTGQISLSSTEDFELSSTNFTDDTALDIIGLGGGNVGFADEAGDGNLVYGYQLSANDLIINGIPVGAATSDGISDVFSTSSAAAKAAAINAISQDWVNSSGETIPGTGVTAEVTPVFRQAPLAVTAGTIGPGDLILNGVDIFAAAGPTAIVDQDTDNVLLQAINAQQATTGIVATRNSSGHLALNALDGRNVHIQTSANGNTISQLNGATPGPQDTTYFGSIQLISDRTFMLESSLHTPYPPGGKEPGFEAIGVSGGSFVTGEPTDVADDGKLSILTFAQRENYVRYTGDREKNAEVKVGSKSKIEIAKNGKDAILDTELFTIIKELEDYLRGKNYTFVEGIHAQNNIYLPLTDLNDPEDPLEEKFQDGTFTIVVTDHDFYPPFDREMVIPVDITVDTPETIAQKINGILGVSSSWDNQGHLHIDSTDPDRYTFNVSADNSNTLNAFGINPAQLQHQGLTQSIADMDSLLESLSSQVSDFGARANRMSIQSQIYANLELANQATLSEKQDTDLTEAILDLKSKEVAYQAALNAAAKTMQLSLVDYL